MLRSQLDLQVKISGFTAIYAVHRHTFSVAYYNGSQIVLLVRQTPNAPSLRRCFGRLSPANSIEHQFHPAGDAQFIVDPKQVVPHGVFA